jgi:hypothetical protein
MVVERRDSKIARMEKYQTQKQTGGGEERENFLDKLKFGTHNS